MDRSCKIISMLMPDKGTLEGRMHMCTQSVIDSKYFEFDVTLSTLTTLSCT